MIDYSDYPDAALGTEARAIAQRLTALRHECAARGLDVAVWYEAGSDEWEGSNGETIRLGAGYEVSVTRTVRL